MLILCHIFLNIIIFEDYYQINLLIIISFLKEQAAPGFEFKIGRPDYDLGQLKVLPMKTNFLPTVSSQFDSCLTSPRSTR